MNPETETSSSRNVRIYGAQLASVWDDPAVCLKKAEPFIRYAVPSGAGLIRFPELYPTGWNPGSASHAKPLTGPTISRWQELARRNAIAIFGQVKELSKSL